MKHFRDIMILISVFLVSSLQATNFYVDSSNGDDSNNGLSPNSAWKTIAKIILKSSNFAPGDSILFKRGEVWNGERLNTYMHPSGTVDSVWSTITQTGSRFFKNGVEMLRAVDSGYLSLLLLIRQTRYRSL